MTYVIQSDFKDDEDGYLYWSNEDGWGHLATATPFADKSGNLPFEADGWVELPSVEREALLALWKWLGEGPSKLKYPVPLAVHAQCRVALGDDAYSDVTDA